MALSKFSIGLLVTIAISYALYFIFKMFLPISGYFDMLNYSVLFFLCFTVAVYLLGELATKKNAKNLFIYMIMSNVLFKLVAGFVLVYLYSKATNPADTYFLIPFLWVYLVFLIFETYSSSKQAKASK